MIPQPGGGGPKVYLGPIKTPLHALFTFYVEMFFALLTSTFVARKSPHPDFLSFFLCQHHHHRHIVWLYHPPSSGRHEFLWDIYECWESPLVASLKEETCREMPILKSRARRRKSCRGCIASDIFHLSDRSVDRCLPDVPWRLSHFIWEEWSWN